MKIRISLIFIALAFLFVSCGSSLSHNEETYVAVDLYDVVQKLSSRAAGAGQEVSVTLWTEGDYETSVTATVTNTVNEPIIIKNVPLKSSISVNLEASIGRKNFIGASDKIIVKEGKNPVTITMNKTVPTTDILLYNKNEDDFASLYFANSSGSNLQSPVHFLDTDYRFTDFCFDAEGNLYYSEKQDGLFFHFYDGTTTTNKGMILVLNSDNEQSPLSEGELAYDYAKNQLWFFTDFCFFKFSALTKSDDDGMGEFDYKTISTMYRYRTSDLGVDESRFSGCVNNDIAYMVFKAQENNNTAPFFLLEFDISKAEPDEQNEIDFNVGLPVKTVPLCSGMDLSYYAEITDMLYQDGALYILLKDRITENKSVTSHGAILKYDVNEGKVTNMVGLAPETVLSDFYAGCYATGKGMVYNSEDENDYYIAHFTDPYTIKAPYKDSINSYFAGPDRFIALKPKKLVISDNGIALYTNAITGALTKKKVNCVIEVDLASLSIEKATKTDVVQEFNTDYEDASISGITITGNFQTNNAYYRNSYLSPDPIKLDENDVELKATILDE